MTTSLATLGVLVLVATVVGEPADAIVPDLPVSGADGGGRVVVSEIAPAGVRGGRDGFFELENPAGRPIDLTGFAVFRCDGEGVRTRLTDPEADLRGVVLGAGERRVFATTRLDERGYGIIVIDPGGKTVDAVAVYSDDPAPMMSECGGHAELPVTTAAALGESWQRVGSSASDPTWVRARATPGSGNAVPAPAPGEVRIEEIAAAGPGGHGDDVLELRNTGSTPVDLGGWRLYRCTATGAAPSDALQHVFAPGLSLAPGARLVVGGPGFSGVADVQTTTSLADTVSGALLTTADGRRVDGVGVSSREDTACQTGRVKLPASLDYRAGESWQRQDDGGFTTAGRTPGAPNAAGEGRVAASVSSLSADGRRPGVAISEIATDPVIEGAVRHNFVEIANYGSLDVDISGWTLVACGADGFPRFDDLARIPAGTQLAAGTTWTAALTGTPAAADADARYETALELAGAGAWLQDASGERVDSVGIYHRNEMDGSVAQESPCTNGLPLPTFAVDRLRGETLQRTAFTGDDASDFAPGAATPGRMTAPQAHAPDDLVTQALALARRQRAAEPTPIETAAVGSPAAAATAP
ncbi:lamin tail domain-containing protein, partial [Microbacterium arthrosphaerae]